MPVSSFPQIWVRVSFQVYSYGLGKKFRQEIFKDFQEETKKDYESGKKKNTVFGNCRLELSISGKEG